MQAIILAAGMGKRLRSLTANNTKCMVKVNGVTLIERMLRQLDSLNLSRIIIVAGYKGQSLIEHVGSLEISTQIVFVDNPIYDRTNNIYSLYLAKQYMREEDTLLLESDLIFEDAVLETLLNDSRSTLALVDKYQNWMDGTCVKLDEDERIIAFISGKAFRFEEKEEYYKTVNLYKFSRDFSAGCYIPFLEAYIDVVGNNEYYEQVLRVIALLDDPQIRAKKLHGEQWYEIDDIQDLDIAESIFTPDDEQRVQLMQSRYGGYWRYPELLDFCYLVNPYFPPHRMMDEMKANFETLLTQYPSGMRVNALLAAKYFGIAQENILVGNGASELIKAFMDRMKGDVGLIRPTFEEYINRYDKKRCVSLLPDNEDYSYTAEDVIAYFDEKDISCLILTNPDNPSGNYIPKKGLLMLIRWAKRKKIRLLIDESFSDFADEENNTLIDQGILAENPHVYVMKSISKSYGVPGLRLGVLASGDTGFISQMKKEVAIWNINSFAEFFLQIQEKYQEEYKAALCRFREERGRFQRELANINAIRVIPSQANFVMVEVLNNISPKALLKQLLIKHRFLIKELSTKIYGRNFLRLAVRSTEDNDKLIAVLRQEINCFSHEVMI